MSSLVMQRVHGLSDSLAEVRTELASAVVAAVRDILIDARKWDERYVWD